MFEIGLLAESNISAKMMNSQILRDETPMWARGLSLDLELLPSSGPKRSIELRPPHDDILSIFRDSREWRMKLITSNDETAEKAVIQNQERLREHSAKRTGNEGEFHKITNVLADSGVALSLGMETLNYSSEDYISSSISFLDEIEVNLGLPNQMLDLASKFSVPPHVSYKQGIDDKRSQGLEDELIGGPFSPTQSTMQQPVQLTVKEMTAEALSEKKMARASNPSAPHLNSQNEIPDDPSSMSKYILQLLDDDDLVKDVVVADVLVEERAEATHANLNAQDTSTTGYETSIDAQIETKLELGVNAAAAARAGARNGAGDEIERDVDDLLLKGETDDLFLMRADPKAKAKATGTSKAFSWATTSALSEAEYDALK